MNVQYISDGSGKTAGVFIPITEWEELKRRYEGLAEVAGEVPPWQREEVEARLARHAERPGEARDFDSAMDELEKEL